MIAKNCNLIKPLTCKKESNIVEVAKTLKKNKQRRIIVLDENESPIGIVSITDINNKIVAENKDPKNTKAEDIMTSPIHLTCDVDDNLNDIFKKMSDQESYFCPVTENKKIYGILTYNELLRRVEEVTKNGITKSS